MLRTKSIRKHIAQSVTACLAAAVLVAPLPATAADHREAPALLDSAAVGQRDINDVYAFQSPENPDNTVLILTVNPFAGVLSPSKFETKINYELNVDNDGDNVEDLSFVFDFENFGKRGRQLGIVSLRKPIRTAFGVKGFEFPIGIAFDGAEGVTLIGRFEFGVFDDPFFFDLNGFNNGLAFTGDDFFAAANVSCIVFEVPSQLLTNSDSNIAVWGTTTRSGRRRVEQIDRMGRPAISTVLIPSGEKDAFNLGTPATDQVLFRDSVIETLLALGNSKDQAGALADFLLPDVLTFDTASPLGFPNGRALADDVIDIELDLLSGGGVVTDGVNRNDVEFSFVFPYLGAAQ